jgi:PAS domain S-box-containing protein
VNKKVLLLGFIVLVGLAFSLHILNEHKKDLLKFHKTSDEITIIPQEIRYYDEVLTMSANMAAFTRTLEWIERYNEAAGSLELSIEMAKKRFPKITTHLNEIEKINKELLVLEGQAIELVKQYKFEEAQNILLGQRYNKSKVLYAQHLEQIIKVIETSIHDFEQEAQKKFELLISTIAFSIFLVIGLIVWTFITFNKQTKQIKVAKESLENQHMLLQKIIDLVPVAMFWKDMDGVYLGANKRFVEDAQLDDISQMIGKTDYDMTWKRDAEQFREDDAAVARSGVPRLQYEEEQPKEDGSCIYLVTSKVPLRDIHDNIIGILGVYNDITEQKIREEEAKEQEDKLFKQARHAQMGEMIAMIAHQWRQPLSSISATVSRLKMKQALGTDSAEVLEVELEKIASYTEHLSKTIDDFRGFFKEDKSKLKTTLEKLVEESLDIIRPTFNSSSISVSTQFECQETLSTYPNELKQVLINLLKNAQEVLDEKEVKDKRIEVKTYKENDKYYVEVYDNADGIDEAIVDKIFEPYFTTKGELNGTGLGLYMSKMIVEGHLEGTISVTNHDGGVSFIVELTVGK